MGCSWICNAVGSSQSGAHVSKHLLPVLHHPVHHLAMKVSVGVVWQILVTIFGALIPTVAYLEALLDGRKQAIAIAFNLENNLNLTFKTKYAMVLKGVWVNQATRGKTLQVTRIDSEVTGHLNCTPRILTVFRMTDTYQL